MHITVKTGMWIFGLLFALFGVLTIQYAAVIWTTGTPWLLSAFEHLAIYTPGAEPGLNTVEESLTHYREFAGSMSTHALVGGLVMLAGSLQFIPALRRNHRQLHRLNGAVLVLFMLAVSATGLYFLYHTPRDGILAGEAFYFALGAVALLSLGLLYQAGLAIASKDFRGHMIWMSLAFSCFLTAPLLRLNYFAVAGLDEQPLNRIVQNSSPTVLTQAFVVMMLWFVLVGDKDLPARSKPTWIRSKVASSQLLVGLVVTSLWALGLALLYQPLAAYFNGGQASGIVCIVLVLLAKTWQIAHSRAQWASSLSGSKKPHPGFAWATLASSLAWLLLASQMNVDAFYAQALYFTCLHLLVMELLLLVLAATTPNLSTGSNLFGALSASVSWYWVGLLPTTVAFWLAGFPGDLSLAVAFGLVPAVFVIVGVVFSSGLTLRAIPALLR
ncbi:MAG TPA: DUF2306 domain-containing protein [Limnobacter sp.]|nr:DUF2306 domain-containing protein [Limnobacter sp.]